jgi:hypothetical protein
MNKNLYLWISGIVAILFVLVLPVTAATTQSAAVNGTCVVFHGTTSGTEQAYFEYGWYDPAHPNTEFSAATKNTSQFGAYSVARCDEPTFLPGYTYKYRACGKTSGCDSTPELFSMYALVPHVTTNFSVQGEAFIEHGGDINWVAMHIWDVYSLVWGSYFILLVISFVFMNIVIKQKSITVAFLLMLISGTMLLSIAPPETSEIAQVLMILGGTGLMYWMYKGRR